MLTKAQIQRLAQRNAVGMQVQERDLEPLLPQFVPYDVARQGIAALLE